MRLLNKESIDEIIQPLEMVDAVKKAFRIYGEKKFFLPERFGIENEGMTLLYMPCFTETICGTKMLTLVPENREKHLPAIDGLVALNHRETGQIEALLDGKSVTAWRTGATGALAADTFAPENVRCIGIVGCGVQGYYQAVCISAVRGVKKVMLYDKFKDRKELEAFGSRIKDVCEGIEEVVVCEDVKQLLTYSQIVVTTTFSTEPVLPEDKELLGGKCYIAVGSYKPYMKELPDSLFEISPEVYVDLMYACEESGDLSSRIESGLLKEEQINCLDQVLAGTVKPAGAETVIFKTVGMALVDMVAAEYLCEKAKACGKGLEVDF